MSSSVSRVISTETCSATTDFLTRISCDEKAVGISCCSLQLVTHSYRTTFSALVFFLVSYSSTLRTKGVTLAGEAILVPHSKHRKSCHPLPTPPSYHVPFLQYWLTTIYLLIFFFNNWRPVNHEGRVKVKGSWDWIWRRQLWWWWWWWWWWPMTGLCSDSSLVYFKKALKARSSVTFGSVMALSSAYIAMHSGRTWCCVARRFSKHHKVTRRHTPLKSGPKYEINWQINWGC